MAELDGVREECGFGNLVDDVEAAVVLGGVANVNRIQGKSMLENKSSQIAREGTSSYVGYRFQIVR